MTDSTEAEPGTWAHTVELLRAMPIEKLRAEIRSRQEDRAARLEAQRAVEAWDSDVHGHSAHTLGERMADATRALVYDSVTPFPHDHDYRPMSPFGSVCGLCGKGSPS